MRVVRVTVWVAVAMCVIVRGGRRASGEGGDQGQGELRAHAPALAELLRRGEPAKRGPPTRVGAVRELTANDGTARAGLGRVKRPLRTWLDLALIGATLGAVTALATLAACGTSDSDVDAGAQPDTGALDAGGADTGAGVDADAVDAAGCRLVATATSARVREGGRVELSLSGEGELGTLTATAGAGVDALEVGADGRRLTVWASYGPRRTTTIRVDAACGASLSVPLEVRPLSSRALAAWGRAEGPDAREHPAFVVDPREPTAALLYGGFSFVPRQFTIVNDVWRYDLVRETWTLLPLTGTPAARGGLRAAVVPEDDAVYLFGGSDDSGAGLTTLERLTWTSTGATVAPIALDEPTRRLDVTQLGGLVWDAPRRRLVSACGFGTSAPHCQVAAIDPRTGRVEVLAAGADGPSPRYGFFAAHDVEGQRLVVFSGAQRPLRNSPVNPATDVWALALDAPDAAWTLLLDAAEFPGRRNGCSAFDPVGRRLFVWGGTPDARTTSPGLWVVSLRPGAESVREIPFAPARPARSSCTGLYDAPRRRVLFGFGNTTGAVFADLVSIELD